MEKITMSPKKTSLTVEEAFNLFIRCCNIKNLSDATIRSYKDKMVPFFRFVGEDSPVREISPDTIDRYILYLRQNTRANDVSINSYLREVRAFLNYCMMHHYLPTFKVRMIKTEKKLKEVYSDEELKKLLEKPDMDSCNFATYRTWTFENFLLGSGMRLSSALNVRISDLDFDNMLITIRKVKNRRQMIIPLSASLAEILREYLEIRGGSAEDFLFPNAYGQKACERTYQTMVYRYNHRCGVERTSIHAFRHSFAKRWVLAGGDIFRLQRILGHSDITVTKEYVNMFAPDLQMDFEKFNPLDNLKSTSKEKIRMR